MNGMSSPPRAEQRHPVNQLLFQEELQERDAAVEHRLQHEDVNPRAVIRDDEVPGLGTQPIRRLSIRIAPVSRKIALFVPIQPSASSVRTRLVHRRQPSCGTISFAVATVRSGSDQAITFNAISVIVIAPSSVDPLRCATCLPRVPQLCLDVRRGLPSAARALTVRHRRRGHPSCRSSSVRTNNASSAADRKQIATPDQYPSINALTNA
jgi:hypothetical protein